jgi:hypothetical protein
MIFNAQQTSNRCTKNRNRYLQEDTIQGNLQLAILLPSLEYVYQNLMAAKK